MPGPLGKGKGRTRLPSFCVADATNVRVYMRVRPFNDREKAAQSKTAVRVEGKQAFMVDAETGADKPDRFGFDECFWSNDAPSPNPFSDQATIFNQIGSVILENAFLGYHSCLFAYGQTGSGKTFTMMGKRDDARLMGIIPRLARGLFERIHAESSPEKQFKVQVSYVEIYAEQLRDLLGSKADAFNSNVSIRTHPDYGPTIVGNTLAECKNYTDIEKVIARGDKARTTAPTLMNHASSRSHAVFTVMLHQVVKVGDKEQRCFSKINLIDLAGSERIEDSGVIGKGKAEAIAINKSLTVLGRVMSALVDLSKGKSGLIPPYRDSVLTKMLQDSLGGNSKTMMFANVSPAAINYQETKSTLEYSSRAREIVNKAKINSIGGTFTASPSAAEESEEDQLKKRLQDILSGPTEGQLQELQRTKSVCNSLQAEADANEARIAALEMKLQQLAEAKRVAAAQAEEMERICIDNTRLAAQLQELENKQQAAENDNMKLETEVARLTELDKSNEAKLVDNQQELTSLQSVMQDLVRSGEAQKSRLRQQITETNNQYEHERRVCQKLLIQEDDFVLNLNKMGEKHALVTRELARMQKESEDLEAQLNLLRSQNRQQLPQIEVLTVKEVAERNKLNGYRMKLATIEDSLDRMGLNSIH